MRILTVRQPWAWAIIHGGKDVENRVRNIAGDYRGPVAIHAAQAWAEVTYGEYLRLCRAGMVTIDTQPRGCIIGVVDLVGVHKGTVTNGGRLVEVMSCFQPGKSFGLCSPWAEHNAVHLELANPRPLAEPIPYKGALGLRRFNETVDAEILKALEALA